MSQPESALQIPKEYEQVTASDCLINVDKFLSHANAKLFLLEAPASVCGEIAHVP